MCLGIPMKVVKIDGDEGIVQAGGLKKRANFTLMKTAKVGDYILMHAGFAIEKLKEAEARKTLKALKNLKI
ncbi:MAG: HypC/HybG/HupF family hydrogenase formation chaperone [Candidatus Omnitrophica bacterium]|nr:HypC/HybG/HupF family hydrogenase formation chaperone [Candidatus Omnitrophota bacterium]